MAWNRGDTLKDGKYTIRGVVGQGGFGITYRVRDENGRQFALKTLNDKAIAEPNFAKLHEDFMNEALRLAQFKNHPHIVKIYKLLQENPIQNNAGNRLFPFGSQPASISLCCILMEYIEGTNLEELVEKRGAIPEAEAVRYIQQIGNAMTAIHGEGLLHRDVKPSNIILRASNSEAVLIDFGIARDFTPTHSTHTISGTICYGAPEQFDPTLAEPKDYTDVYALAATLYHLVTGTLPTSAVFRAINAPLKPIKQIVPSLSDELHNAIVWGMELLPQKRPQTVQSWLKLLSQIEADDLSSDKGIDYRKLRDLLKGGSWKEADEETLKVMLKVAGREKEGWLCGESIDNFPCTDLRTIDQLWVKYSKGRFGFSVQKRIWESVGGKPGEWSLEIFKKFCDRVGWLEIKKDEWKKYPSEYTFSLNAPVGHLPCVPHWGISRWLLVVARSHVQSLLSRRDL
ncbi:serine/threonine-protein kinase [Argonema galeatum]|uniref:serine/threonine-protein kinase n=1 Tax=Argonema galeatum TaxID=2942762 RepID=UPI002011083C|nr:serine/threonine-protein kinase [Argonema galeatum]MCL1464044.1 GUN4 domain-containing protein [Argonema galeatum A003/A1]